MNYVLIVPLLCLMVSSCTQKTNPSSERSDMSTSSKGSTKDYAEVPHIDLIGPKWFLREINGKSVKSKSDIYIHFKDSTSAEGFSGCNRFNGPYTFEGNRISVGALVTTRMTCDDQETETLLLNVLSQVESYDTDSKFIYFKRGEKVLAKLEAFYL